MVAISSLHNLNTANVPQFLPIFECQQHYCVKAVQRLIISLFTQHLASNTFAPSTNSTTSMWVTRSSPRYSSQWQHVPILTQVVLQRFLSNFSLDLEKQVPKSPVASQNGALLLPVTFGALCDHLCWVSIAKIELLKVGRSKSMLIVVCWLPW